MKRSAALLFVVFLLGWITAPWSDRLITRSSLQLPAAYAQNAGDDDIAKLRAEIETLKTLIPDQANAMMHVEYHLGNMWFAGRATNWPLMQFYLNQTRSHLDWAVRLQPTRQDANGTDVQLKPIVDSMQSKQLTELEQSIQAKDFRRFAAAYEATLASCVDCHQTVNRPELQLQIPNEIPSRLIRPLPPGRNR
jgi:cytochrome c553